MMSPFSISSRLDLAKSSVQKRHSLNAFFPPTGKLQPGPLIFRHWQVRTVRSRGNSRGGAVGQGRHHVANVGRAECLATLKAGAAMAVPLKKGMEFGDGLEKFFTCFGSLANKLVDFRDDILGWNDDMLILRLWGWFGGFFFFKLG